MNEERAIESLRTALKLLREADCYLTDGDEIEEITEEGSPDVAQWALQVRELLERQRNLIFTPEDQAAD